MGGVQFLCQKMDLNPNMKMAYKSKNFPAPYTPHFPQSSLRALDHSISELKERIKAGGSPVSQLQQKFNTLTTAYETRYFKYQNETIL